MLVIADVMISANVTKSNVSWRALYRNELQRKTSRFRFIDVI